MKRIWTPWSTGFFWPEDDVLMLLAQQRAGEKEIRLDLGLLSVPNKNCLLCSSIFRPHTAFVCQILSLEAFFFLHIHTIWDSVFYTRVTWTANPTKILLFNLSYRLLLRNCVSNSDISEQNVVYQVIILRPALKISIYITFLLREIVRKWSFTGHLHPKTTKRDFYVSLTDVCVGVPTTLTQKLQMLKNINIGRKRAKHFADNSLLQLYWKKGKKIWQINIITIELSGQQTQYQLNSHSQVSPL